jgi:hypothetical protein
MTTSAKARWLSSARTTEIDGSWTRAEIADALKRLAFAPGAQSRRVVLIDSDVRDLLVAVLDR